MGTHAGKRLPAASDSELLAPREAAPEPPMLEYITAVQADFERQEHVVSLAADVLDAAVDWVDEPIKTADASRPLSCFESRARCPLKPSAYLRRILYFTRASPCTIPVGLLYLQRLRTMDSQLGPDLRPRLRLTCFNIQRLLLTAVMLACKFLDEPVVSNKQWALIGDITTREMHDLEVEMLWQLKFGLGITREEYDECITELIDAWVTLERRDSSKPSKTPSGWTPVSVRSKDPGPRAQSSSKLPFSAEEGLELAVAGNDRPQGLISEHDHYEVYHGGRLRGARAPRDRVGGKSFAEAPRARVCM
jgi:hypothetical protein